MFTSFANRASGISLRSALQKSYVVFWSLVYYAVMHYAHEVYLSSRWGYYGFYYWSGDLSSHTLGLVLVAIAAVCLPIRICTAGASILLILYIVVVVPAIAITLHLSNEAVENYSLLLLSLTVTFSISCLNSGGNVRRSHLDEIPQLPQKFLPIIFTGWIVITIGNVMFFGGAMRISGFGEEVYEQRRSTATDIIFIDYAHTLYSNVFTPALQVIGHATRSKPLILLGVLGAVLMYSISAQRTVLLLPILIYSLFRLFRSARFTSSAVSITLMTLAAVIGVVVLFAEESPIADQLATFLVFRTLSIPGLTLSQYYDVFNVYGYTWWSHVRILSLFVSAPEVYVGTGLWPGLGYIVGLIVYDNAELNANANLFSGDGAAAAGEFGVMIIGLILCLWIMLLNRVSAKWHPTYSTLFIVPFAISLTNAHLFTSLLSFGGLLWLGLFALNYRHRESS